MSRQPRFEVPALPGEANDFQLHELPKVKGRRVCLIIPPTGFRDEELFQVKSNLEKAEAKVFVACSSTSTASGMFGSEYTPEMLLDYVNPVDFDALVLVGGFGVDNYFETPRLLEVLNQAQELEKVVGAIGTAPALLALAGLLRGRKATAWVGPSNDKYRKLLSLGGGRFTGEAVEVDWPIITAAGEKTILEFSEVMVEALDELARLEAEAAEAEEVEVEGRAEREGPTRSPVAQSETPSPAFQIIELGPGVRRQANPGPPPAPDPAFEIVEPPSPKESEPAPETNSPWARPQTVSHGARPKQMRPKVPGPFY